MKISIVTPSYNQAQFIERTLQSILSQQGDFELESIVVDGGSTDGSVEIIKRMAEQDKRVQWVSEKDNGQSDAINKGLRKATGDVVAFLNSDDIYYPGTLQQVAKVFADANVMWAYGQCRIIDEQDVEIKHGITKYKNFLLKHYAYWKLLIVNYISQPATFWRKQVLAEVGYIKEDEHLAMDYEFWCRLGKRYPAAVIPEYLAGFRSYATSKSGAGFNKQFKQEIEISDRFTRNPFIRFVHRLHANAIILAYKLLIKRS